MTWGARILSVVTHQCPIQFLRMYPQVSKVMRAGGRPGTRPVLGLAGLAAGVRPLSTRVGGSGLCTMLELARPALGLLRPWMANRFFPDRREERGADPACQHPAPKPAAPARPPRPGADQLSPPRPPQGQEAPGHQRDPSALTPGGRGRRGAPSTPLPCPPNCESVNRAQGVHREGEIQPTQPRPAGMGLQGPCPTGRGGSGGGGSRGWELFLFYLLINLLLIYLLINLSAGWGGGGTGGWLGWLSRSGRTGPSVLVSSPTPPSWAPPPLALPSPSPSTTTFCTDLLSGRNSGFA